MKKFCFFCLPESNVFRLLALFFGITFKVALSIIFSPVFGENNERSPAHVNHYMDISILSQCSDPGLNITSFRELTSFKSLHLIRNDAFGQQVCSSDWKIEHWNEHETLFVKKYQ